LISLSICLVAAAPADPVSLARVKELRCSFSIYASGSWKTAVSAQTKGEESSVDIVAIDVQEGTAEIKDATPPTPVTAMLVGSSLHILERTMSGSLTITTVFADVTPAGKLRAVQSHHEYVPVNLPGFLAQPSVSQHYGECDVVN
jgi:hypothetical protein